MRSGLLFAVFVLTLTACGGGGSERRDARAGDTAARIKIGVLVPLSGDHVRPGTEMLNAAILAADELNATGGVLGRQLEIVSGDDRCDPQTAGPAADRLVAAGVVGVVGGYCSGAAIPASAATDAKGIPYISTFATNPAVTDRGLRTVFRVPGRDDQQAAFAARYLAVQAGVRKLALLHDNTVYAKDLAERTRAANDELKTGMEIVFFDAIKPGESDYRAVLRAIRTTGADALYFTGYPPEWIVILRQARELALPLRLTGGDGSADPGVIEAAGQAAEGFVATHALLPEFLPRAGAFLQTFHERFGTAPGPSSVYQYDGVKTLANAIFWAGSIDPKDIVEALRTTRHEGLIGEIAFDAKGDRQSTVYATAIVRDGKFHPHKKLDARGNWVDG